MSAREIAIEELSKLDVDASAAMVDATLYQLHQKIEEDRLLASLTKAEEDVKAGRLTRHEDVVAMFEARWK